MIECPYCRETIPAPPLETGGECVYACGACLNVFAVCCDETTVRAAALPGSTDVRRTATPESLGGKVLMYLRDHADRLPVLPEISTRIMEVMQDESSSMGDLAGVIREDAVVAANVLKVANSAMFGGLQSITELDAACARLGQRNVSNIAQTVATESLFQAEHSVVRELMERLWRHSVAVALFSAELGRMLSMPHIDRLYLQGLFHDIGKLAILGVFNDGAMKAEAEQVPKALLMELVEAYHPLTGVHLLKHWDLPAEFMATVYWHEDPEQMPSGNSKRVAHIIALANDLAYVSGVGFEECEDPRSLLDSPSSAYLQMSDIKLASVRVDLEEKLAALMGALTPEPAGSDNSEHAGADRTETGAVSL